MSTCTPNRCDPCRFRDKRTSALFYCQSCMEYYCKRCRRQHLKFRLTMGHLVTELGNKGHWQCQPAEVLDHVYYDAQLLYNEGDGHGYEADILKTDAARRCHLSGRCAVHVARDNITVTELDNHVTVCWPYTCIRKYGSMDDKLFFFESGRRCDSGEGRFVLKTEDAVNLHKTIVNYIRTLSSKLNV